MKKHYFAFALLFAISALCACGLIRPNTTEDAASEATAIAGTVAEPTTPPTATVPFSEGPTDAPTAAAPVQESYFRQAQNWSGAGGQSLSYQTERVQPDPDVLVYYDKLIFDGTFGGVGRINTDIAEKCDAFIAENYESITGYLAEYENNGMLEEYPDHKNIYSYTELKDVYTDGKYLSIQLHFEWWAGGVINSSDYGLNYDLTTGSICTLADYYSEYNAETVRSNILKSAAADMTDEITDPSCLDKPLTEINFYFYKDTVAINFGPYEIGWGGWSRTNEYPIAKFRTNNSLFAE